MLLPLTSTLSRLLPDEQKGVLESERIFAPFLSTTLTAWHPEESFWL